MNNPLSLYKKFHGREPRTAIMVTYKPPATLVCLGRAVEIVYQTNKRNGGGTGKTEQFIHKFGAGDFLYCDESGRKLFILGGGLKVNSRGIVG